MEKNQENQEVAKVISFRKKDQLPQDLSATEAKPHHEAPEASVNKFDTEKKPEANSSFAEVMQKNDGLKEKMRQARQKANQSVLKSYKIKT